MKTLKDIAKECSVSIATVSNILNNKSNVSTETKERVLKVIKESGRSVAEVLNSMPNLGVEAIAKSAEAMRDLEHAVIQANSATTAKVKVDGEALASEKEKQRLLMKSYNLLNSLQAAEKNWTKASTGKSSSNYAQIKEYSAALSNLITKFKDSKMTATEFNSEIIKINDGFKSNAAIIKSCGENTKSFSDALNGVARHFGMWLSLSSIIMRVYRSIREMISASIELDDAMTQLKIVTRESDSAYEKFGNTIAGVAKRTATSISDIVSSATVYARLGYSLEESTRIAEYTAKLQNVGDIDVSDAQDAITSILKAYDEIDADHIEDVMNKLVVTGNNFPISVSQIAEGMNNASSALAAAGNTFEQSVALLAAANTTVQDAAKASTGLRTIAARIRKTDTELDDLGESMTSAKYDSLVKSLADLNVALVDVNGEYRATYDIMADIASKWDSMTTMEQAALADVIAGTRQQAIFFSLIEQFQEASGAMDAMAGSANALDDAYSVYLESTTAHINQFKASFQELSSVVANSDLLKWFVDFGRSMTESMTVLAKVNALLPTVIGGAILARLAKMLTTVMSMSTHIKTLSANIIKEKVVTDQLMISVSALNEKQKERLRHSISLAVKSEELTGAEARHIIATYGLAKANTEANLSFKSLFATIGTGTKSLLAAIPGWGWAALAISALIPVMSSVVQKSKEIDESFANSKQKYEDHVKVLNDYRDAISEIALSEDDEATKIQKLINIKDELSDRYNTSIENIESEGQARNELNKILDEQLKKERELFLNENEDKFKQAYQEVTDMTSDKSFLNGYTNYGQFVVKENRKGGANVRDNISKLFDSTSTDRSYFTDLDKFNIEAKTELEYLKKLEDAYIEFGKIKRNAEESGNGLTEDELSLYKQIEEQYKQVKKELTSGDNPKQDFLLKVAEESAQHIIDNNPQLKKSFAEWREELVKAADGNVLIIDAIDKILDSINKVAKEAVPDAIDSIMSDLQRVEGQLGNISDSIKTANDYFEDLEKVFKKNADTDKFFTASEIIDLLDTYPELYDNIKEISTEVTDEETDLTNKVIYGYKIEKEALEALRDAKIEEQRTAIQSSMQETYNLLNDAEQRLDIYAAELDGIESVTEAKIRSAEVDNEIALINKQNDVLFGPKNSTALLEDEKKRLNNYIQASEDIAKFREQIEKGRVQLALLGRTNDDAKDSTQDATRALNEEKEAVKKLNDELKEAQDDINDLIKLTMDMIKKEKELQKEALKEQLDNYKKLIDRKKELIDLEKDQYNFERDLKEQNKDVLEIQQELDALSVEGVEYSLEDMKRKAELQEKLADTEQKRTDFLFDHEVDVRKDALDKEKELFEDNINTQTKAIEDYLKHEGWIRQEAIDLINSKTQEFYNDLYNYTLTYTSKSDAEFTKLWNDAYSALEKYGDGQIDVSAVLAYLLYQIDDCDNKLKEFEQSINSAKNATSDLANTIINKMGEAAEVTGVLLEETEALNEAMGASPTQRHIPGTPIVSPGHSYWSKPDLLGGLKTYHSGGIVEGGSGLNKYTEVLAKLMSGEVVITPNQAKTFMSKTLPTLSTSNVTNNQMSPAISIGDINISGNADSSTVSQLKEIQKEIVDSVFKAVNGQRNLYNGGKVRMA